MMPALSTARIHPHQPYHDWTNSVVLHGKQDMLINNPSP